MTGHTPPPTRRPGPVLRLLSLGAGIQSTAVLLLACDGAISPFDVAFFADTGWEPQAVYDNVERLRVHAARAGIPVRTVSAGDIRQDAVDVEHGFASMPLHVKNPDGSKGLARRQCTAEYKIRPLKAAARAALGYPAPRRIPRGVFAEQAIGISVDEIGRAKDADVSYLKNVFPLLDLGWTRADCESYLTAQNWVGAVKSACLGCPFHSNSQWREIRDNDPAGWADVVLFDQQVRHGHPRSQATGRRYFLHPSCQPLDEVDLDRPPRRRPATTAATATSAVGAGTAETEIDGDPDGCSPWACRSGTAVPAVPAAPAIRLENVA